MGNVAIRVEGLSKRYDIGAVQRRHDTVRDLIADKISNLIRRSERVCPAEKAIWALKDISFEVKEGEVVGLVGSNGAGKSTLLKILSRITEPMQGWAQIHGRVGSLLEVGTGFHPELSGRENIYLNGAILGMKRTEIASKFDEIVGFAETEKFLDTPVKHYSSGMYLRLAFAVAAHLDPQILLVDEVLAVGDVKFQKKCLGKMQDISKGKGRTILFVSHNMDAVRRLCGRCLLLSQGRLLANDNTTKVLDTYLNDAAVKSAPKKWIDISQLSRTGTGEARFVAAQYSSLCESKAFKLYSDGPVEFLLVIDSDTAMSVGSIAVTFYSLSGVKLVNADSLTIGEVLNLSEGRNVIKFRIDKLYLNPGPYVIGLWIANPILANRTGGEFDQVQCAFEVEVMESKRELPGKKPDADGLVTCRFELGNVCGLEARDLPQAVS